ncbi:SAM-dependent methyltransferase [Umezawaea beigongshangensis]|uniref:SAM-dependent methyltransferase n=1 Tax=Umezawaea beigongshangensis TaxID=2780383 RepID=UPI0018F24EF4|nr:cyclopropane-fatty-acyl-phospholipid synthase family protein [Umezawaea beigongshangensis]
MRLATVFQRAVGASPDVRFRAYDGSKAGPAEAEVSIEIRTPEALSYLASAPGELGLARAYVTGNLEITGDVHKALSRLSELSLRSIPLVPRLELLATLGRTFLNNRVEPPPQERRLRGIRHSKTRDSEAIAHHYDVSNAFYERVLGPSMAYTCAVYPEATSSLEEAQFTKHDLVARKLGLKEGMRLLDLGCGWGGMVMHAAKHYGVRAIGVTLSRNQAEWAQKAIVEAGLSELAEVRHLDYRDVRETGFDAVSAIGLAEHIGKAKLPGYFGFVQRKLKPGGRMLNHCITRPDNRQPARSGSFINRYVFPDGELVGPGHLVSVMNDSGFEIRHEENLREHYAMTLAAWCRNLDEHWDEAVREVGEGRARVWRLYLAASRLGFDRNSIQLHQVLGVKLDGTDAHVPLRPDWA